MRGRLYPADGDWYEWRQEPPLSGSVFVRVTSSPGGRLVLSGLRIETAPTAELLRAIPVGRIEAAANAQLTAVDSGFVPAHPDLWWARSKPPVEIEDGWETTDPAGAIERPHGRSRRRGRPDLFYRQVAHVYVDLAQASARPAADLAAAHKVPVTTAHRWIKEARRRGFLPPGQPGKAG